jgi:hypothetical protein
VSDSFKPVFKIAVTVVLSLALCLALVAGLAACGDDATDDTGDATTTSAEEALDQDLIGVWQSLSEEAGGTIEFTADGLMIAVADDPALDMMELGYRTEGGMLVVIDEGTDTPGVAYTVEGDILTLDADPVETYQRILE